MAKISELPIIDAVQGDESIPVFAGDRTRRVTPKQIARLMDANPRANSLADASLSHFLVVEGGRYFNPGANQTGAVKIGLPIGIDAREVTMRVLVRDHYGSLIFHIAGRNDGAWNYPTARVEGQHQIVAEHPVFFGNDGTRDCIWIGRTDYAYWDYLTVMVMEATFTGPVITEAWAEPWFTGLTTTIENAYAQVATFLPVTRQHLKIDASRLALAIGVGAGSGSAPSNYNTVGGAFAGGKITSGFNNTLWGMQAGSEITIGSANFAAGTQALQFGVNVIQNTAINIHALLNLVTGTGNVAIGAGTMEYGTNMDYNVALGNYAGRDLQGSNNLLLGNRAGMLLTNVHNQLHIANNEYESLIQGDFALRWVRVNGRLTSEGVDPANDNTFSLGRADARFAAVFCGSGQISTSDERQKTDIDTIPDAWLDAWDEVEWCRYKFLGGKRDHVGLIAQRVHAAFARHGIDAFETGAVCYDEWPEESVPVMRKRKVKVKRSRPVLNDDGSARLTIVGEDAAGKPILGPETEAYTETIERLVATRKKKIIRPAGSMWGLRYDECFALEAAWQRRNSAREANSHETLEARVVRLEAAISALAA